VVLDTNWPVLTVIIHLHKLIIKSLIIRQLKGNELVLVFIKYSAVYKIIIIVSFALQHSLGITNPYYERI